MKTIVVPVDFSEESLEAVDMALELARQFKAEIQMVYVQPDREQFGHVALDAEKHAAEVKFLEIIAELNGQEPTIKVTSIVKRGRVYREIVNQAEALPEAVIVTSTHGASGFEEFFVGSNTLKIIANTQVPVYTIRHGVKPTPIKNIVFPMDASTVSRQKSGYVSNLALAYGAKVHVLGVMETHNDDLRRKLSSYLEQMRTFFSDRYIPVELTLFEEMDIVDASIAYSQKLPGALIAVSSMNRKSLPLLLIGGKSQRLLSRSNVPVLCLASKIESITGSFRTNG